MQRDFKPRRGGTQASSTGTKIRDDPVYSTGFVLTGRTPLGPVALSLAITSESDWQLVFGLGRPIEERAITDPVW